MQFTVMYVKVIFIQNPFFLFNNGFTFQKCTRLNVASLANHQNVPLAFNKHI